MRDGSRATTHGFAALNDMFQNLMSDVPCRGSNDDHYEISSRERFSGSRLLTSIAKRVGMRRHARYFNVKTSRGLPAASQCSVTIERGTTLVGR